MKYTEFIKTVRTEITARFDNSFKLEIRPVEKNNGKIYDGLVIFNPNFNIAPTIYLNPYYHWYLNGVSMDAILDAIVSTYKEVCPNSDFDVSFCQSFERAKSKIIMQLINYEKNKSKLEHIPHIKYLDLAVIFQLNIDSLYIENGTITITDKLAKSWDVTTSELISVALKNMPSQFPVSVINLADYLREQCPEQAELITDSSIDMPLYILTNSVKTNGAAAVLYPDTLAGISKKLGGSLILIPSSIHEFLVMKYDENSSYDDLNRFIREVNSTQLRDDEILSDRYYIYDASTNTMY